MWQNQQQDKKYSSSNSVGFGNLPRLTRQVGARKLNAETVDYIV